MGSGSVTLSKPTTYYLTDEMMTTVNSRIKQAPACKVIDLEDHEDDIYNSAGWRLARFVDGKLEELFNTLDHTYERDTLSESSLSMDWYTFAKLNPPREISVLKNLLALLKS